MGVRVDVHAHAYVCTKMHTNCVFSKYYLLYAPVEQLHVIHFYRQFVRNISKGIDFHMARDEHDTAIRRMLGYPLPFAEILQRTCSPLLTILM